MLQSFIRNVSGGRLPSGTEIGEGGYHRETYGAEHEDLAYKGLGGTAPHTLPGRQQSYKSKRSGARMQNESVRYKVSRNKI